MKTKTLICLVAIAVIFEWQVKAQTYDTNNDFVQTFAGSGFAGLVNGVGQQTMFNSPKCIVADSHNNLFVWDWNNAVIRKITTNGTVSTFAQPTDLGYPVPTAITSVFGMAIDRNDNIYLGYSFSRVQPENSLFKISSNGTVTVFSSSSAPFIHSGGSIDGICSDSAGNIYVALASANFTSSIQHQIYRLNTNNVWSVFAGSGNPGYAVGNGIFTSFNNPSALAIDAANNIYVWDSGNNLIRKIDQNQNVTTFAGKYQNTSNADGIGTNASFNSISQMCFDKFGNLLLACGNCIRSISTTTNVTTLAGIFPQTGYTNGVGNLARFNGANGVCISSGTIYVADSLNQRIRSITNNLTAQSVFPAQLQMTFSGLQIIGSVGLTYQIQSSTDLNTWTIETNLPINSIPCLWIDQNQVSGNKFYRALLLP